MSYLIQNFTYTNHFIRSNLRVRTSILARNFLLIFVLFSNSSKLFNMNAQTYVHARQVLKIWNISFKALAKVLFPKLKFLRYTPIGINFPRSAHYRTLKSLNDLLHHEVKSPTLMLPLSTHAVTYPYYTGSPIAITPIAKKPFSYAMYKFLRMSLNLWFSWPKQYKLSLHYTSLNNQWLFLRFLNKYYFKVYNV